MLPDSTQTVQKEDDAPPEPQKGHRFYYVYEHIRNDTREVFYVGKGTWSRSQKYKRAFLLVKRNTFWNHVVSTCGGYEVEVVAKFDREQDAFEEEKRLISKYGKRSGSSLGTLCNLTDGGEGLSGLRGPLSPLYGRRLSEERRQKMSEASSGERNAWFGKCLPKDVRNKISSTLKGRFPGSKNPFFGRAHSEETRKKMSDKHNGRCVGAKNPRAQKIFDLETAQVYGTVKEAAKAFGIHETTLRKFLKGRRPNKTPLRYLKDHLQQLTPAPSPQADELPVPLPDTTPQNSASALQDCAREEESRAE